MHQYHLLLYACTCWCAWCIANAGEMVQRERDKTVELEFNRLLDSVSHLSHHLQVDQLGGEPLSLGQALELVIQYVKITTHYIYSIAGKIIGVPTIACVV